MYKLQNNEIQVFLVHPGGPFWAKKDAGAWSIPKGEFESEDPLEAAKREFQEETGFQPEGVFVPLQPAKQPSCKIIFAWALEGDCNPSRLTSNTFSIEWPPGSGHRKEFPEVDRAEWFPVSIARDKILKGQLPLLYELERLVSRD